MTRNRDDARERLTLAGDALVVSSGLFAWLACVAVALTMAGWDLPAADVSGAGLPGLLAGAFSLLMTAVGTFGAPALVWWLHGRRASWMALLGAVIAGPVVLLAAGVLAPAVAGLLGFLLRPLTDWEYAGPVALLVLVGIGYAIALAFALLMRRPEGERRALRNLRWISAGGLAVLTALVVAALLTGASGELGEALIFGMMFGASSAVVVTGADILDRLGHRKAAPAT